MLVQLILAAVAATILFVYLKYGRETRIALRGIFYLLTDREVSPLEVFRNTKHFFVWPQELQKQTREPGDSPWAASMHAGRRMKVRPSDVFITTTSKAGTTLTSFICHVLRTHGENSMDFDEITEVVPWNVMMQGCEQDYDDDQVASPRLFKTHDAWFLVPKQPQPAKHVYICRDPVKKFLSVVPFIRGWIKLKLNMESIFMFTHLITPDMDGAAWWDHYLGFWRIRDQPNILFLFYEDIVKYKRESVQQIAEFMEIDCDEELMEKVLELTSHQNMSKHNTKFNDNFIAKHLAQLDSFFDPKGVSKVSDPNKKKEEVSPAILDDIRYFWETYCARETGCATYQQFREKYSLLRHLY